MSAVHRCPKCGKKFAEESSVTRHRRQPNSACARLPEPSSSISLSSRLREYMNQAEHGNADGMGTGGMGASGQAENGDGGFLNHFEGDEEMPQENTHYPPADDHDTNYPTWTNPVGDNGYYIEYYASASTSHGSGETFLDVFDKDRFSGFRRENLYYPFASRADWEVGSYLHGSGLSMSLIDELLSLELIKKLSLSFRNAKELRGRIELLPSGPPWSSKPLPLEYPTKNPVVLFYRDPIECLRCLMSNPLVADNIEFKPFRVFLDREKKTRVYTEWLSGDVAWSSQENLPVGATLLGVILSSDKTAISVMTGNRLAYPLLISLANIKHAYRTKSSHNTFMLLALLPVAKFIHKDSRTRSLLHDRLIHSCLDLILQPLKDAAKSGIMIADPLGYKRFCFTRLASYTVDTPEAQLLACVGQKTSPLTMSYYKQFGDSTRHEPRSGSTTLAQLQICKSIASPSELAKFLKEAQRFRLNGVDAPFWRDWELAEPFVFLTPEPLHHWHKQFWDHDVRWCINIVGPQLIDFFFSLLHYRTGYRQFREGISGLKQVTGRTQRDIERYIIPVIALVAPWNVVFPLRCLMDFRYYGQSPAPTNDILRKMLLSLNNFHIFKDNIILAGGRRGSHGNIINNWYITKLELYQSVVANIIANGCAIQFTADVTEHCHITEVKEPAHAGNNQNYDQQIVLALDREHKRRYFDLATSIKDARMDFRGDVDSDESGNSEDDETVTRIQQSSTLLSAINPVSENLFSAKRKIKDYFRKADLIANGEYYSRAPAYPLRTFVHDSIAFNLSRDPSTRKMTIAAVAEIFSIPDLHESLLGYVQHLADNGSVPYRIGGRRTSTRLASLPSDFLQVWYCLRIQSKAYHYPHDILEQETINCRPPSNKWPRGLYDCVLLNSDSRQKWPESKLAGHDVVQMRLIFRIVTPRGVEMPKGLESFLAYAQRFDIVPQYQSDGRALGSVPNPVSGMYALRRSLRSDGSRQGGIVQVSHIRAVLSLVPCFRKEIDPRLNKDNCMDYYTEFWLNDYFDKEMYWTLRS